MPFLTTVETGLEWASTDVVLTSAVANTGTVTVAYPSGTSQATFIGNRATTEAQQVILDDNNVLTPAQATLAYGASNVTVTNASGVTWAVGTRLRIQMPYVAVNRGVEVTRFTGFTGRNGAGAINLAGTVVGDRVIGVVRQSNAADSASLFEGVITVAGQLQQVSTSDLSAVTYFLLLGRDAG